jgi:hypothetical protein
MSGRQEKKLRRLHRKDFNKKMEDIISDVQKELSMIHKPAPRFFPKRLWRRLGRIFLNI